MNVQKVAAECGDVIMSARAQHISSIFISMYMIKRREEHLSVLLVFTFESSTEINKVLPAHHFTITRFFC